MRTFASLALVILALDLMAFDSADWLGKRELLTREAERLRAAYTNCVARLEAPADDVTVPVETFPDGSVKVVIHAKRAQYFADTGLVWAEGVTAAASCSCWWKASAASLCPRRSKPMST